VKRETVKQYLSRIGSKGGKATGPRKARTSKQARAAAMVRWWKRRAKPCR
jgi:hypothetical protein